MTLGIWCKNFRKERREVVKEEVIKNSGEMKAKYERVVKGRNVISSLTRAMKGGMCSWR